MWTIIQEKPGFFNDKLCMCVGGKGGQVGRDRGRKNTIDWDVRHVSCNTWILIWTNNEKYETIREVWLLTGYLLVLQNYFSVFIYVNGHVKKEPLSFKDALEIFTDWNIYRWDYVMSEICLREASIGRGECAGFEKKCVWPLFGNCWS